MDDFISIALRKIRCSVSQSRIYIYIYISFKTVSKSQSSTSMSTGVNDPLWPILANLPRLPVLTCDRLWPELSSHVQTQNVSVAWCFCIIESVARGKCGIFRHFCHFECRKSETPHALRANSTHNAYLFAWVHRNTPENEIAMHYLCSEVFVIVIAADSTANER